jgi:hypothetical protein
LCQNKQSLSLNIIMQFSEPITLKGKHVSLVPLKIDHLPGLTESVRDGELWNLWYTSIPTPG